MSDHGDGEGFGTPPPRRPGGGHPAGRTCPIVLGVLIAVPAALVWGVVALTRHARNRR